MYGMYCLMCIKLYSCTLCNIYPIMYSLYTNNICTINNLRNIQVNGRLEIRNIRG